MYKTILSQLRTGPFSYRGRWLGIATLCLCMLAGFVPAAAQGDYVCGDLSGDEVINVVDLAYFYNYLFKGGPPPITREAADVDDIPGLNTNDCAVLIDYLFQAAPPPECGPNPDTILPVTDDTLVIAGGRVPAGMAVCEVRVSLKAQNLTYGMCLPLSFGCQTSEVICESIAFAPGLFDDYPIYAAEIDNTEQKTVFAMNSFNFDGFLPANEYYLVSLWFRLSTVDEYQDQIIDLDTTGYAPENIVIFTKNRPNHEAYIPTIVFSPDEIFNSDADFDGVFDAADNCPLIPNPDQLNGDGDEYGDACDNCPLTPNNDQLNSDSDEWGDACDNCPNDPNYEQVDTDSDGLGDVCDACPEDSENDVDGDGVCGNVDNCPVTFNPSQQDSDGDSLGDACDGDGEYECGDINADGWINVSDVVYLINFIFKDGPRPCQPE